MLLFTDWLTVFLVGCLAVMSPGPNLAIILRNSLVYSRKTGVLTAVGLAIGNCVHAAYCLIGIGVIITQSILLFNTIKWLGAAYLIFIGIRALRAQPHVSTPQTLYVSTPQTLLRADGIHPIAAVRMGFLTNLLNPKVTLFFLALFTQIIHPSTPIAAQMAYGLTIVGIEFGWFASVSLVISQPVIRSRFEAIAHWVERATGVVLIVLGIRVALTTSNQ